MDDCIYNEEDHGKPCIPEYIKPLQGAVFNHAPKGGAEYLEFFGDIYTPDDQEGKNAIVEEAQDPDLSYMDGLPEDQKKMLKIFTIEEPLSLPLCNKMAGL